MKFNRIMLCVVILLPASFPCAAAEPNSAALQEASHAANAGALFEEDILVGNSSAVRAQAAGLSDEARFDRLRNWVLPSESHPTIRMTGDFTQTNPAPFNRIDGTAEHRLGGGVVSPVFDLLDLAKRTDRLGEILGKVDAVPEAAREEQQRAKAALQTLLHLELGNTDEAAKLIDRLSQLVRTSDANEISEMWPETLVVYRCVVRKVTVPGIDDLLAFLFSQRTQRDVPENALVWHSQIAALAGQNGHREVGAPFDGKGANSELTQWIPISLRRAVTRGQCLAAARWARVGSQVDKIAGHNDDYLFFRIPLTCDYEVQCDVSAFTTQAMAAGTFVGNDSDRSHLWKGTFRNSASRIETPLKFSGFDEWIHHLSETLPGHHAASPLPLKLGEWNELKLAVNEQQATMYLNGQPICECEIDASNDRVFGLFHFADQTEARVRNVTMRGNWPLILPKPDEQELADSRPMRLDSDLEKLTDVFTHDFAKDGVPDRYFTPVQIQPAGKVETRQDGLFIHRPGGGPWHDIHVNLPFVVHGDFDLEVGFAEFKAIGEEHGCIMLVVELEDGKRQQCRILRIRDELQRQELHSSLSEIHQDGGRSYSTSMPKKTEASNGRLRMARRGTTLYYLFAENDSSVFRVLTTAEISDSPSVSDGLHFHTMCNGKGETSVLWKSISLRAERLTLKPHPNAKLPTNLYVMEADGSNVRLLAEPRPGFTQLGSFEWSADGRQLIGDMSSGGVETSRILLMDSDGSNLKDLGDGCMPSLSGDASEIVFSQPAVGVMKMNSNGTNRAVLERRAWGVQWAPDGRTIAFANGNNITLLNTESGNRRSLLPEKQAAMFRTIFWNFGWAGNSHSIGFKATLKNGDSAVNVVDLDNPASLQTVYSSPLYFPENISLSPDATIVFFPAFTKERARASFMFVDRNRNVATFPFLEKFRNWNITGIDCSPDGRSIAFTATVPPATTEWPPMALDLRLK